MYNTRTSKGIFGLVIALLFAFLAFTQSVEAATPVVTSVSGPAAGTYATNQNLDFKVVVNQNVNIAGSPTLSIKLTTGGTVDAAYVSGESSSSTLLFRYVVVPGNVDYDGVEVVGLNRYGSIKNLSSEELDLTLNNVSISSLVIVDAVLPTVTISGGSNNSLTAATLTLKIDFSRNAKVFNPSAVIVTNATKGSVVTTAASTTYYMDIYPSAQGWVSAYIPYGYAQDLYGNPNVASNLYYIKSDVIKPTATLYSTVSSLSNNPVAEYHCLFSEIVTGFDASDLNISNGSISAFQKIDDRNYSFVVTAQNAGLVSISINADAVSDLVGNNNLQSKVYSFTYDNVKPYVTSVVVPTSKTYKLNAALNFDLNFNKIVYVTGQPYIDLLAGSNSVRAYYASGSGSSTLRFTYEVNITDKGNVAVTPTINLNKGTILDASANASDDLSFTAVTTGVLVDGVVPIIKIGGAYTNYTNVSPIVATITFSKDVSGFTSSKLAVVNATVSSFTANSSASYTVSLQPKSQGTVSLGVSAGSVSDNIGNFSTGATYTIVYDNIRPSVSITNGGVSATKAATLSVNVQFSEVVMGFVTSTLVVSNAEVSHISTADNKLFVVTLTNTPYDLTLATSTIVKVSIPSGSVTDYAGNINLAATQTVTYTYDVVSPKVKSVTFTTTSNPLKITGYGYADLYVTFDEVVYSSGSSGTVYPSIPIVLDSRVAAANLMTSLANNTLMFEYLVSTGDLDTDGIVVSPTIVLNGNTSIKDAAGNVIDLNLYNISAYNIKVDGVKPKPVITTNVPFYTNSSSATVTFTFSEPVTSFTSGVVSGGSYATLGSFNALSATQYTLGITPSKEGRIYLSLVNRKSSGGAYYMDAAGNENDASTYVVLKYDVTAPSILSWNGSDMYKSNVTLTFSEPVLGLSKDNVQTDNCTVTNVVTTNYTNYTLTVVPKTSGIIKLWLNAAATTDSCGNKNTASTVFSYDKSNPVITNVETPSSGQYLADDVLDFKFTFSKIVNVDSAIYVNGKVSGYTQLYMKLAMGADTVHARYYKGTGTNELTFRYNVQNGDYDDDNVISATSIKLNGGTINDVLGNTSDLSFSKQDVAATIKGIKPSVSLSGLSDSYTNASTITLQLTVASNTNFESVSSTIFKLTNCTMSELVANDVNSYLFDIYPIISGSAVKVVIPAKVITDNSVSNKNEEVVYSIIYDNVRPTVTISGETITNGLPATATITFSEPVPDFTESSIVVDNGAASNLRTTDYKKYYVTINPQSANADVKVSIPEGKVYDYAGNRNFDATFSSVYLNPHIIHSTIPTNGRYKTGEKLQFIYEFENPVIVAGKPSVVMTFASEETLAASATVVKAAFYSSATPTTNYIYPATNTLVFQYTVSGTDIDDNGVEVSTSLNVDPLSVTTTLSYSTSIQDGDGNAFDYNLPFLASDGIIVDGIQPKVSITSDKYYNTVSTITLAVKFSEPVMDFSPASVTVTNASTTNFVSASDGLNFYLDAIPNASGTKMEATIDAGVAHDLAGNTNIASSKYAFEYDVNVPTVTITNSAGDGSDGATVTIQVTFNKVVDWSPVTGTILTNCTISNFTTTDNKKYILRLLPESAGLIGLEVPALAAKDMFGFYNTQRVTYSSERPLVTSVSGPKAGSYKLDESFDIQVNTDKIVTVTGTPYLQVYFDNTIGQAKYVSSSASSSLIFRCTVTDVDSDSDGLISTSSTLVLNSGTIKDSQGNNLVLTAPSISASGIFVDGIKPSITFTSDKNDVSSSYTVTIVFTETVLNFTVASLTFTNASVGALTVGSLPNSYSLDIAPKVVTTDITINAAAGSIIDLFGNKNDLISYTVKALTVSAVTVPAKAVYSTGDALDFKVTFTQEVNVTGTPVLRLVLDNSNNVAKYVSGTGTKNLVFRYYVNAADTAVNGITILPYVDLNGFAIKSISGKEVKGTSLEFTPPSTSGIVIKSSPVVTSVSFVRDGNYKVGDELEVLVRYNGKVSVANVPKVGIYLGATKVLASYTALLEEGKLLSFKYVVESGKFGNGITLEDTIELGGKATIKSSGLAVSKHLYGITGAEKVYVDGISPYIKSILRVDPIIGKTDTTYNSEVKFKLKFNEKVNNLKLSDIVLSGSAKGVVTDLVMLPGVDTTVTVGYLSGRGSLSLTCLSTAATDVVLNSFTALTKSDSVYRVGDGSNPLPISITRQSSPYSNSTTSSTLVFRVSFSEIVKNVDVSDFELSGTASGNISSVAQVSSFKGAVYDVTVSDISVTDQSGEGTLGLILKDSETGIVDIVDKGIIGGISDSEIYNVIDVSGPSVDTIVSSSLYIKESTSTFTVKFNEKVTGVDLSDFDIVNVSGTTGATLSTVTPVGDGYNYSVQVSNIIGEGTFALMVKSNATIADYLGNKFSAGDTSAVITSDKTSPTILSFTRFEPFDEVVNVKQVIFRATFSEPVYNLNAESIKVKVSNSNLQYEVSSVYAQNLPTSTYWGIKLNVNDLSDYPQGNSLTIEIDPSLCTAVDKSGNKLLSGSTSEDYSFDYVRPVVTLVSSNSDLIQSNSFDLNLNVSEPVSAPSVSSSLFTIVYDDNSIQGDTRADALISVEPDTTTKDESGTRYTSFKLSFNTGITYASSRAFSIRIAPAKLVDVAGNSNYISEPIRIAYDNIGPSIASIVRYTGNRFNPTPSPDLDTVNFKSVYFKVTFRENGGRYSKAVLQSGASLIEGVDVSDFSLALGGGTKGSIKRFYRDTLSLNPLKLSDTVYIVKVELTSASTDGWCKLNLNTYTTTGISDVIGNSIPNGYTSTDGGNKMCFDYQKPYVEEIIRIDYDSYKNYQLPIDDFETKSVVNSVFDVEKVGTSYIQRDYKRVAFAVLFNTPVQDTAHYDIDTTSFVIYKDPSIQARFATTTKTVVENNVERVVSTAVTNTSALKSRRTFFVFVDIRNEDGNGKLWLGFKNKQGLVMDKARNIAIADTLPDDKDTYVIDNTSPKPILSLYNPDIKPTKAVPVGIRMDFDEDVSSCTVYTISQNIFKFGLLECDNATSSLIYPGDKTTTPTGLKNFTKLSDRSYVFYVEPVEYGTAKVQLVNITRTVGSAQVTYSAVQDTARNKSVSSNILEFNVVPRIASTSGLSFCKVADAWYSDTITATSYSSSKTGKIYWYSDRECTNLISGSVTSVTKSTLVPLSSKLRIPQVNSTTVFYVRTSDILLHGAADGVSDLEIFSDVDSSVVYINEVPTVDNISIVDNATRCNIGKVTIVASSSLGQLSWFSTSIGGTSLGSDNWFTTPVLTDSAVYYLETSNRGCKSSSRKQVIARVNYVPDQPGAIVGDKLVDRNDVGTYSIASVNRALANQYKWTVSGNDLSSTSTSADFTWTSAGTFKLSVLASNDCGNSDTSSVLVTVNELVPDAPVLVLPADKAVGQAIATVLSWNMVTDAKEFVVRVSTSSEFKDSVTNELYRFVGVVDTSYRLSGLNAHTTYYWQVYAVNSLGNSKWSKTWSFTTGSGTGVDVDKSSFSVYPNPAVDVTLVSGTELINSISILTTDNKEIRTENVSARSTSLDVHDLSSGMYLLRVNGVHSSSIIKLIKQ